MSTYQQSPAPGWGGAPVAVGHPALQQTVAPHLYPGEVLVGTWPVNLDPLLPLYWDSDLARSEIAFAPARWVVNSWRIFWRGLWTYFLPRWFVEIFVPNLAVRRPYGLRLGRRAYRAIRRPMHGGSWSGGEGSIAWQFWRAIRLTPGQKFRADHDLFIMVLTDRRMLALSLMYGFEAREVTRPTKLFELPRGSFFRRPETPKSIVSYREDLLFSDGSWIALAIEKEEDVPSFAQLFSRG